MKHPTLLVIFLSLLTLANTHAAQVYKWIDERGQTQFSQFPPEKVNQAEEISITTTQSASSSDSSARLESLRQQLSGKSVERDKMKKEALEQKAINKQNCKMAKNQLREAERGGRRYTLTDTGRHYLDDKELAKSLAKAKKEVTTYCSK